MSKKRKSDSRRREARKARRTRAEEIREKKQGDKTIHELMWTPKSRRPPRNEDEAMGYIMGVIALMAALGEELREVPGFTFANIEDSDPHDLGMVMVFSKIPPDGVVPDVYRGVRVIVEVSDRTPTKIVGDAPGGVVPEA